MSRSWRRRAVVVSAILAGVGALFAAQLLLARAHLVAAQRDLHATRSALTSPLSLRDNLQREKAGRGIQRAHDEFAAAEGDLKVWSWLLPHLGWVPLAGPQLRVAPAVAASGGEGTASMLQLLDGLQDVWPILGTRSQQTMLTRLTPVLEAARPHFRIAATESSQAVAALGPDPPHTGDPSKDRLLDQFFTGLKALQSTSAWMVAVPDLLGARQPTNILLGWIDPREIRAGGGFIGSANFLTVNRGAIVVHPGSATKFVREHHVPLPLPEAEYTDEGFFQFCDSNWSPHYPLSARLERWTYGKDTGRWATTVVNVPGAAAATILQATGPVYLSAYHRWVNAANAESIAQYYIYGTFSGPFDAQHDEQRKRFLGSFMSSFVHRLESLPVQRWPRLGAALTRAVRAQQILLYDRRSQVERAIAASGAGGEMASVRGDYLMVVDDNRSYNKLAPYIHQTARYDISLARGHWVQARLELAYHVAPSPHIFEAVGPYWGLLGSRHDLQDFIRVYVPPGAVLESTSGLNRWAPEQAYGRTQFAGRILVRAGESHRVIFRYRIPTGAVLGSDASQYSLLVQRQVGTRLSAVQVRIHAEQGLDIFSARAKSAHALSSSLRLVGSRNLLSVGIAGAPTSSDGPSTRYAWNDPYLPYSALGDRDHPF